MRIGGSLFLIALGAILAFAVTRNQVDGIDLNTVGVILMIVGALGLCITLGWMASRRRTDVIYTGPRGRRATTYVEPNDPIDGPY
jgi:hypothetical protein